MEKASQNLPLRAPRPILLILSAGAVVAPAVLAMISAAWRYSALGGMG